MKEYFVKQEDIKNIIEDNNLIDNAINYIRKYFSKEDFDEYDVAKIVFDDIGERMKSVADKIWLSEDCNKYMYQLVRERMKLLGCRIRAKLL